MPTDKPAFLKGVDEDLSISEALTPEEKENDLPNEGQDAPLTTDKQPTEVPSGTSKDVGEDNGDKPKVEGEGGDTVVNKDAGDGKDNKEVKADEGNKPDGGGYTVKKDPEKPTETKVEPEKSELIFGKYKNVEEAEKGYKELEGAFSRANNTINAYRTGKMINPDGEIPELKKIIDTPLIPIKKMSANDYTDKEGIIDLDRYMADYSRDLVLSIQKSFLGGPLAAVQFDILKNALLEEHGSSITEANKNKESMAVTDKLYNSFPILKENKQLEEVVSNAITGAKMSRASRLKAEGKEYVDFTYDEYAQMISSILGAKPSDGIKTQPDPVENIRPQTTMSPTTGQKNEMDDIISGMEQAGNRSKIF